MPILPHQLQSCLTLSPSESPTLSGDQLPLVPYPDLPPSFPSTSVPRGMADFNDFGAFELVQPDDQRRRPSGDYEVDVQPDDMYRANETNFHYQHGTPPELETYWPQDPLAHGMSTSMASLHPQYVQQHTSVPSNYPIAPWVNTSPSIVDHVSAPSSSYSHTQHSPPGSSRSFGPYSNVHVSPGGQSSGSLELERSPYTSSSHLSPPPTTPNAAYGLGSAEDPTYNADGHREQLRLFKEALQLPMSLNAGPFVPQKMYIPHTNSDRRRYVEEIDLQHPIYFWMHDPEECGIPLIDALHSRVRRLQLRDEPVFEGRGPSISVRIQWPGYRPWSRQIPTKDFRSPPQPITKAKLAKNIAKCVERFLAARATNLLEDDADPRWKVGTRQNEIKLDDLILISMHHVSMGSWQPHLRLRRPLPS